MKYSIIIPTYNEHENLPLLVSMINEVFEQMLSSHTYEIVVVDDNSPDGTLKVAQSLEKGYGNDKIKILSRPGKLGLGSAYIDGLKITTGDFIILMDADMSHHPKYIPQFIRTQEETKCDIVTGTRYGSGGGVAGWDMRRILTSRGANLIANLLLNPGVSDLTGSFRLFKRPVVEDLLKSVKSKTYVFQMEVIVRAKAQGYQVEEVPIVFVDRLYGESKLGANEIVSYLRGLWALFLDI